MATSYLGGPASPGQIRRSSPLRMFFCRAHILFFCSAGVGCVLFVSTARMLLQYPPQESQPAPLDMPRQTDDLLVEDSNGDEAYAEPISSQEFAEVQKKIGNVESIVELVRGPMRATKTFVTPEIPIKLPEPISLDETPICWTREHGASVQNAKKTVARPPSIIPRPVEMQCEETKTEFVLSRNTTLYYFGASAALLKSFHNHFRCFFKFDLKETTKRPGRIELVEQSNGLPDEGYTLNVMTEEGDSALVIEVSASTSQASILHALQSLRQLLAPIIFNPSSQLTALTVPHCSIRDWPRYRWRGIMLDVARHFFSLSQVKDLLLLMSMHKFNILHLHLTDDQGWRIEVDSHPELFKIGGRRGNSLNRPEGDGNGEKIYNGTAYAIPRFFSKRDLQELIAFAQALNIEVVPEIDVPAHTAALLVAARSVGKDFGIVELHEGCDTRDLGTPPNCMGGTHGMLVPTDEALQYTLETIAEVADLFPSKYFHLGGDEADEFRDSAYSSDVAEKLKTQLGLWSSAALQGYMVTEVHKFLRARGKTVIAWDETHLGLEGYSPPDDIVMMWWRDFTDEASWDNVEMLERQKILTPMSKMYFDIYQTEPHAASRYRVQEGTVGLHNTYSAMMMDGKNVLGVHSCLWSEHLETQGMLEYQMFPRAAAAAEVGWTRREHADFIDFQNRWKTHAERLVMMNVQFYNGTYTNEQPYTGEALSWGMSFHGTP